MYNYLNKYLSMLFECNFKEANYNLISLHPVLINSQTLSLLKINTLNYNLILINY